MNTMDRVHEIGKHFLIFLLLTHVALAGTYYVDNNNAQTGDGSFANPWQTLALALPNIYAGDTLLIRGDTSSPRIYPESMPLYNSGSQTQPIVIKAYPGELVELQSGGTVMLRLNKGGYIIEDLIFNHLMTSPDAIRIQSSYNILRNCEIKNGTSDGIDIGSGDYNIIEYCKIYNFNAGAGNDAHGIVIDDGNYNIFRFNEIYDNSGDCVQILHGTASWTEISDNHFYTTLPGISENAIDVKSTHGVKILRNIMHGFHRSPTSKGDALVIHHQVDSVTIRENVIYESNGGMRFTKAGQGTPAHIVVERNLIHDLVDDGQYSTDGFGIQLDGVIDIKMYNNTLVNIPGPLFWIDTDGATDVDFRNNLFVNGNDFHGSQSYLNGNILIAYNGWFNCTEILDADSNSVIGTDPLFVDPVNYDYHLQPGSPCIDAGDPAFGSNYPGGRIDIGRFEFTGGDTLPPAAPTNLRIISGQ